MFSNMQMKFEIKKLGDCNGDCVISEVNIIMMFSFLQRRIKHPYEFHAACILYFVFCKLLVNRGYILLFFCIS